MTTQIDKVYNLMKDGRRRTLMQIQNEVRLGGGIPSVSATLRRMRQGPFQKKRPGTKVEVVKFGNHHWYRVSTPVVPS